MTSINYSKEPLEDGCSIEFNGVQFILGYYHAGVSEGNIRLTKKQMKRVIHYAQQVLQHVEG